MLQHVKHLSSRIYMGRGYLRHRLLCCARGTRVAPVAFGSTPSHRVSISCRRHQSRDSWRNHTIVKFHDPLFCLGLHFDESGVHANSSFATSSTILHAAISLSSPRIAFTIARGSTYKTGTHRAFFIRKPLHFCRSFEILHV